MEKFKMIYVIAVLVFCSSQAFSVGISVSGPSVVTMEPGQTTRTVRYYISYSPGGSPWTSSLHYIVDGGGMVPANPVGDGSNNPSYVDIALAQGSHSIEFKWLAYDWVYLAWYIADTETENTTVKFNVYITNIFGAGTVNVDGTARSSGYSKPVIGGNNIGIGAIEQSYDSYNRVWSTAGSYISKWVRQKYQGSSSDITAAQSTTYTVSSDDNSTTLEAGLRKECNITFSNQFSGSQDGGQMKVNGGTVSAPTSAYNVVEQNAINVEANYQYDLNYIKYTFDHWENEAGGRITTFYPSLHKNYKAVYTGRPIFNEPYNRNLHFNTYDPRNPETNVVLYWNEHSHEAVTQYQIWRQTKYNGVLSDPVHLTTVNRGTTSWTDYS